MDLMDVFLARFIKKWTVRIPEEGRIFQCYTGQRSHLLRCVNRIHIGEEAKRRLTVIAPDAAKHRIQRNHLLIACR